MDGGVELRTARLRLRPWRPEEAGVHRQLWLERDPRVPARRRIDAAGRPTTADLEAWIRAQDPATVGLLAVERLAEGDVIGYCGLTDGGRGPGEPELAYELLRSARGHGYATEAAAAVVAWAREAGTARLWADVWDWNTASRRVLARLGFTEVDREAPSEHGTNVVTMLRL